MLLARLGKVEAGARDARACAARTVRRAAPLALQLRFEYVTRSACTFRSTLSMHARRCLPLSSAHATRRATWHWSASANPRWRSSCSAKATSARRRATPAPCWRTAAATLESRYRAFLALGSLHQDAYDYDEASRLYREAEDVVRQLDDDIAMASWLQRAALTQAAHARQAAALGELGRKVAGERSRCSEEEHCLCQLPCPTVPI